MTDKQRLGEMLLERDLIDNNILQKALQLQSAGKRRIGYLLVRMGYITEDELQTTLSRQLKMPLIKIEDFFDPTVKRILPKSICRQYTVLPLKQNDHNILDVAMVDPSDAEAIKRIEKHTGQVIRANLARHGDIEKSINAYIPWSFKDLFIPENITKAFILTILIVLALASITIMQFKKEHHLRQVGTRTKTHSGIEFKNHDLSITMQRDGAVLFRGYGQHARGSYNITFNNVNLFKNFIASKKNDFSDEQWNWLHWILAHYSE